MTFFNADALRAALLHASGDPGSAASGTEYDRAVADLLHLLGLIRPTNGGSAVADETAEWLIKSFIAHLDDRITLADGYQADWLNAIEADRYAKTANPSPIRDIVAANALIKTSAHGVSHLLMQYDVEAAQFQLIGGKREISDPDLAFTVLREIQEELACPQIAIPADLQLVPLDHTFDNVTLSPTYGVISRYHIAFFHVHAMRFQPVIDYATCWITVEDIRAGKTTDGRRVSRLAFEVFGDQIADLSDSIDANGF